MKRRIKLSNSTGVSTSVVAKKNTSNKKLKVISDLTNQYLDRCVNAIQVQEVSAELDLKILDIEAKLKKYYYSAKVKKINSVNKQYKILNKELRLLLFTRKALANIVHAIISSIQEEIEWTAEEKSSYRYRARFNITWENIRYIEGYELLQKIGFYNRETNPNGAVKDHRFSIKSGIDLNIPPEYLGNTANCEFLSFKDNIKKSSNNSITFEEFCNLTSYCPSSGPVRPR